VKRTKSNAKYPKALKRKIAEEYLAGKFSYAVAAEEYGLVNKDVVKEFVRWYRRNSYLEPMKKEKQTQQDSSTSRSATSNSRLESQRIEELEKELAVLKLKLAGMETLIDVAEQELNIDIRKKSGTKRFK